MMKEALKGLFLKRAFVCLLLFLQSTIAFSQNIYVNVITGSSGASGTQLDPFDRLSEAVTYANSNSVDTIFVASGTYNNGYDDGVNQDMDLTASNIVVYGADPSSTIFVLGGGAKWLETTGNNIVIENIQVVGQGSTSYYGALHINSHSNLDSTYVRVENCFFQENTNDSFVGIGSGGGAINAQNSSGQGVVLTVNGCQFLNNNLTGSMMGGSVYSGTNNHLNFFSNRVACSGTAFLVTMDGGIIGLNGSTANIYDSYLSGGRSGRYGGGMYATSSVGLKEVTIRRCVWIDNATTDGRGGAIYLNDNIDLYSENSEFTVNSASGGFGNGGGVMAINGSGGTSNADFVNCTFADNTAGGSDFGSLNNEDGGLVQVLNCIFFGNDNNGTNIATGTNNCTDMGGNIFVDPDFTNTAGDDYTLLGTSVAIDAGLASSGGLTAPTTDMVGTSRSGSVDAGCYELGAILPDRDSDCSSFLLIACADLMADAVITHTSCGNDNGQVTFSPFGTIGPYVVTWSGGETQLDSVGIAAGSFTVTLTDGGGCSKDTTVVVNGSTGITSSISSSSDVACFGNNTGAATVTTDGQVPLTILWNDASAQTTLTASSLLEGTYNVDIMDNNGCTTSSSVTINGPASQLISGATVTATSCGNDNGQVSLNPNGGNGGPFVVTWTGGETVLDSLNMTSGSYTINVADAGGCDFDTTLLVGASIAITSNISSFNDVSCYGEEDGSATVTTDGSLPLTVSWDDDLAQTSLTAIDLDQGTYNVSITDNDGCITASMIVINEPDPLEVVFSSTDTGCGLSDGELSVVVSGGDGAYSYDWTDTGGNTDTETGLSAGVYNLTVLDGNLCQLDTFSLVQNPNSPTLSLLSTSDVTCWGDQNGEATVQASGGTGNYSFLWDDPLAQTSGTASDLDNGTYTVEVTDESNCTAVLSVSIDGPLAPLWISGSSINASCSDSNGELNVSVVGGTSPYTFDLAGDVNSDGVFENLSAGVYDVVVTDDNGCSDLTQLTVGNVNGPELDTLIVNSPVCQGDENGDAFVTLNGGTPGYNYYLDGNLVEASVNGLSPGIYEMLVVDMASCSLYVSIEIEAPDSLMAVMEYTLSEEFIPSELSLDASNSVGVSNYEWILNNDLIGNSETENLMISEEGNYQVSLVVDNGLCYDTLTVSFDINEEDNFKIPNVFTPNGDGINDFFTLENNVYDYVHIVIYNRWGTMLYTQSGSNISWDGKTASGEDVSDGTYFYLLTLGNSLDEEVQKVEGYVCLQTKVY